MAEKKEPNITEKDLFGSIPKPLDINPFEGIDIEGISALIPEKPTKPPSKDTADDTDLDIQPLNALDGIDIDLISADGQASGSAKPTTAKAKPKLYEPINPIDGIDLDYVAVSPKEVADSQFAELIRDPRARLPKVLRGRSDSGVEKPPIGDKLVASYKFAEIQRLRESVLNAATLKGSKTVAFVSPHDGVGATFLTATIGLNAAEFCSLKVLLIDLNMRRPELHQGFGVLLESGFGDVIQGDLRWKAVIHATAMENLHVMTAGAPIQDLSIYLDREFLLGMFDDLKIVYDLIICDTSPLLIQNRNNVDPGLVGSICDLSALIIHNNATTKSQLKKALTAVQKGGGQLGGIILNEWS